MTRVHFTAYGKPQPQGSARAFVRGNRAVITSDNTKLKPFRSEVAGCAIAALSDAQVVRPAFEKHVAVRLTLEFLFRKPASVPKHRRYPVVKPDLDKTIRSVKDALTGIVWHDDAQVVTVTATKRYGDVEGVTVTAEAE